MNTLLPSLAFAAAALTGCVYVPRHTAPQSPPPSPSTIYTPLPPQPPLLPPAPAKRSPSMICEDRYGREMPCQRQQPR